MVIFTPNMVNLILSSHSSIAFLLIIGIVTPIKGIVKFIMGILLIKFKMIYFCRTNDFFYLQDYSLI